MANINIPFSSPVVIDNNTAKFYNYDSTQTPNWIVRTSTNVFYAACTITVGNKFGVFKSVDYGETWTDINYPFVTGDINFGNLCIICNPKDDTILVMYTNTDNYDYNIIFCEYDGDSWGTPVSVTDDHDYHYNMDFDCCFDVDGNLYIVYQGDIVSSTDVLKFRSRLYGGSISAETIVQAAIANTWYPNSRCVYSTYDNLVHWIYSELDNTGSWSEKIYYRTYDGIVWSDKTLISDTTALKYHKTLYFNADLIDLESGDEGIWLIWTEKSSDTYYMKRNNGNWTSKTVLYNDDWTPVAVSCHVTKYKKFYIALQCDQNGIGWTNIWSKYTEDGVTWSSWQQSTDCNDGNEYMIWPFAILPFDTADIVPVMYNIETP